MNVARRGYFVGMSHVACSSKYLYGYVVRYPKKTHGWCRGDASMICSIIIKLICLFLFGYEFIQMHCHLKPVGLLLSHCVLLLLLLYNIV